MKVLPDARVRNDPPVAAERTPHPRAWRSPSRTRTAARSRSDAAATTAVPIRVPGYGRVRWTALQIEVYAEHLARHHRPARAPVGIRWLWGFLPVPYLRHVHCRHCGQPWICDEGAWADRWQTGLHRGAGTRAPSY